MKFVFSGLLVVSEAKWMVFPYGRICVSELWFLAGVWLQMDKFFSCKYEENMNILKEGGLEDPTKNKYIDKKGCSYVAMFSILCSALWKVECVSLHSAGFS